VEISGKHWKLFSKVLSKQTGQKNNNKNEVMRFSMNHFGNSTGNKGVSLWKLVENIGNIFQNNKCFYTISKFQLYDFESYARNTQ
jgi:hypothetical protein